MAGYMVGSSIPVKISDKRKQPNQPGSPLSATFHTANNDITALKARLTAINAAIYTAAYLNTMNTNDMVYAIRMNDDPLGF